MSKDNRKHPRQAVYLEVEVSFPSGGKETVKTQDVSNGGVFLIFDQFPRPIIGEVVTVKLVSNQQTDITFPSEDAVVIRQDKEGIGLAFIELDFLE